MPYATRDNRVYLLAKASQRWNEQLQQGFAEAGATGRPWSIP
jgi:hypothetical protein